MAHADSLQPKNVTDPSEKARFCPLLGIRMNRRNVLRLLLQSLQPLCVKE